MHFNLSNKDDLNKAYAYLTTLAAGGKMCDIVEKKPLRSNQANRYLHKLFQLFGLQFGLTVEESKEVVKVKLGYVYTKKKRTFLKHTSKMDKSELTAFIDKFRRWSGEVGCPLPSADEYNGKYEYFENLINQHKNYL